MKECTVNANYLVTEDGKVLSKKTGRCLKGEVSNRGYLRVTLSLNGAYKKFSVHRLVAEAYLPNPENKPQVNHKDSDRLNNHVDNLEWCTSSENNKHAYAEGNNEPLRGSKANGAVLKEEQVLDIYHKMLKGVSLKQIHEETGIDKSTLGHIKRRSTWEHLTGHLPSVEVRALKKLSDEILIEAAKLILQGLGNVEIANKLGLSRSNVNDLRKRKTKRYTFIMDSQTSTTTETTSEDGREYGTAKLMGSGGE